MKRRRRHLVIAVAAVALLAGGVLAAPAVARQVVHPRDPEAFQANLVRYIDTTSTVGRPDGSAQDRRWVIAHPDEVLALGDQACAWLADQEDAPADFDPTGATSWDTRYRTYLRESGFDESTVLSDEGKLPLVGGAWHRLCWWDWHDKIAPVNDPGEGD